MEIRDILGVWQLDSFTVETPENPKGQPWGLGTHGLLIYSDSGYMSVSINKLPAPDDEFGDDILFYAGTYEVNESHIIHNILNASDRSRIGKQLFRTASLHEPLLTLASHTDGGNRAHLIWRKMGK